MEPSLTVQWAFFIWQFLLLDLFVHFLLFPRLYPLLCYYIFDPTPQLPPPLPEPVVNNENLWPQAPLAAVVMPNLRMEPETPEGRAAQGEGLLQFWQRIARENEGGEVPEEDVEELARRLMALNRGEGNWEDVMVWRLFWVGSWLWFTGVIIGIAFVCGQCPN